VVTAALVGAGRVRLTSIRCEFAVYLLWDWASLDRSNDINVDVSNA
jgi:hypothetical protein